MAKNHHARSTDPADVSRVLADMVSTDEATRARAVRAVCPCRLGWDRFEQCLDEVKKLQKDPSPAVRGAALHVFEDAYEMDNSGLPTTRQETTNEMAARKRRSRWQPEDDEEDLEELQHREVIERLRDQERAWKQARGSGPGRR